MNRIKKIAVYFDFRNILLSTNSVTVIECNFKNKWTLLKWLVSINMGRPTHFLKYSLIKISLLSNNCISFIWEIINPDSMYPSGGMWIKLVVVKQSETEMTSGKRECCAPDCFPAM